ncbi:MAG: AAC(3) family N-acetyltransferase [Thermoplasmata archaeon]|nr:AAC(3) family N-acetyltransferase [Thermoplasmata archaeon]
MPRPHQGEADAVGRVPGSPATRATLVADLRKLGLAAGSTVLVHSSLSALGWVVGGAETVVRALEEALGEHGTLMMPAYSMNAPEPSLWKNPAVPEAWWETIRTEWPPFDAGLSPAVRLGTIAETFRSQRGTERSYHPNHSFSARGPKARELLDRHSLDDSLGEGSPLARLYERGGQVLLLGVDHASNSSLHLSEYRATWPGKHGSLPLRARVVREGVLVEIVLNDLDLDSDDFGKLGADYEAETGAVRTGSVGVGAGRLMAQPALVDFGVRWLETNRR